VKIEYLLGRANAPLLYRTLFYNEAMGMAEKQKLAPGKAKTCNRSACLGGLVFLLAGIVGSLFLGWCVYPKIIFSPENQPVNYSHPAHSDLACTDCHKLRDDGTFQGLPPIAACVDCHSSAIGDSEAEKKFVEEYMDKGLEVPWLVYQHQPSNVFFSHAAHSFKSCVDSCHPDFSEKDLCAQCHPKVADMKTLPPVYRNWATGYTKDTMRMPKCERCHAIHMEMTSASNACFVCHK
jgi:hypothetical protein